MNRIPQQAVIPGNTKQLTALVKRGEGSMLKLKRSTGELKEWKDRPVRKCR